MLEISFNPVLLVASFMAFLVYMYQLALIAEQERNRRNLLVVDRRHEDSYAMENVRSKRQSIPHHADRFPTKPEKMDVEEFKPETIPHKTLTSDLSRITHTKRSLFGPPVQEQTRDHRQAPEASVVWQAQQVPQQSQLLSRPSQPMAMYPQSTPAFMQGNQIAMANPAGANMPPLFVGFLTNDVSMQQIRQLFTSYTKAANDSKSEARLLDKKAHVSEKRGRFDLRHLEESEEESEQESNLGKRDLRSKDRKELIASKEASKNIDKNVIKKGAVKLKTDSSTLPQPIQHKDDKESPKKTPLFDDFKSQMAPVQKKTSFSAVPELTKEEKPKPAVPQEDAPNKGGLFGNTAFGNKPLESGVGKSGLFSAKETADESSKEPANAQTSKQAGGSLFDNFASKITDASGKEKATGLFSSLPDVKEPIKKKLDNQESKEEGKSLFTINLQKTGESEKTTQAPKSTGLFGNITKDSSEAPKEGAGKNEPSSLFVRTTPGGLFSTAMNANSEKDKLDASFIEGPESPGDPILEEAPKKSGLFGNVTENPAKNLNSMFEKASDQTSQPEKTSIFAGANRENRNDAENPFVTSGQKSMEHGTTTLNDLINRNPSSMFVNKESPALTATPSIFQTGNATNPNPFMGNQSAKPQGIFGTMVPQAGQGSIFGQAGASSIFNNPGTSAPGGLFGNLGAGTSSSTGLFGNNK